MTSRMTVESVAVAFEGIVIPGRGMITMQLAEPRQRWAVLKDDGREVDLITLHESEEEAVSACKELVAKLERMSASMEGGSLQ